MTTNPTLTPAAAALHRDALVLDAHADTLTEMTDRGYDLDQGLPGTQLDLARCAQGVLDAQVFTCFVHPSYVPGRAADRVRAMLDTMDRQFALFPDRLVLCRGPGDIVAAREAGLLGVLLAIEGGHAIEDDLDVLREFHGRGVRTMTLTWNNSNEWADGCGGHQPHGGLTVRGREVVAAMEELRVVVDISHVARSTFDDVLSIAQRPVIASHSCARALRDHPRNLDDDQLRAVAQGGGVACVNFYPGFLVDDGDCTLEHLLDHVMHFVDVAGPEHVGLGSDFDGIPESPVGMADVSDLPQLTAGLAERGLNESAIRALLGGNLLRIFDGDL
ncbi:MAG: membrane dipeptidase [Pseudohongiellaceae bacterium]|jgi:membrane dipeptidase